MLCIQGYILIDTLQIRDIDPRRGISIGEKTTTKHIPRLRRADKAHTQAINNHIPRVLNVHPGHGRCHTAKLSGRQSGGRPVVVRGARAEGGVVGWPLLDD